MSNPTGAVKFLLACIVSLVAPSQGIYEDQIGKFDWVQQHVGVVEHAVFDDSTTPAQRIIIATAHNVLAALSTKNGDIVWRHVMEETESSGIDFMAQADSQVTIVSDNLVRTWDSVTAALIEEVPLDHTPLSGILMRAVGVSEAEVVITELIPGSLVITTLDRSSGASLDHVTIGAPWLHDKTRCKTVEKTLVCVELSLGLVFTLPFTAPSPTFASAALASLGIDDPASDAQILLERVGGSADHIVIQVGNARKLVHIHNDGLHLVRDLTGTRASAIAEGILYSITQSGRVVTIEAIEMESGNEIAEQGVVVALPFQSGFVLSFSIYRFERRDGGKGLRAFVTCSDHSLHLLSSAGVVWSREEALASILATESVDLPIDGGNINYHEQLTPITGIVGSFLHRVKTQCTQVAHWFSTLVGSKDAFQESFGTLTRDQLNLRKLLVVATSSGKILGIDSWNGDVVWSIYASQLAPLQGNKLLLYSQRTSAHFPHQPQCVVIGRSKVTGEAMLVVFNPISGVGVGENDGIIKLGYSFTQAFLMQHADEQYLKPLLLVDTNLKPHMFPASGESVLLKHKNVTFLHMALPGSSDLTGYSLRFSEPEALRLTEVWKASLGGGPITGVYGKLASEKVHSPGRVLADRSVLYKYVNPNLAVVITQGYDHITKNSMTLYLVDTVTGAVIDSVSHKKVSGPIHIVHSENWVVYSLFNDKFRRFEVTSLELYEGLTQANATAFSSFSGHSTPLMERQAYIMPMGVQSAAHTTTEKGITTKFILFALQSGGVVQMSKWFLDPRRPVTGGPREEGLIPYVPELRLLPQETITYNHTLPRITGIFTAPTGLESACLVLVYGLDLFYTRVFPSKMFDVLKDDFDHYLILGALLALLATAFITRKLAQKKALKQAWK